MATVKIPVEDGTSLPAYLARPASDQARTGVIVAHELFGVNPDIRGVADDLAGAGFLTIRSGPRAGQLPRSRSRVLLAWHSAVQPGGEG